MEKKLNDLLERLTKEQEVECARPEKTAIALKECIDRKYVHIMFKATETELGIQLYSPHCNFENANFDNAKGRVQLTGALTLNYEKVKCVADIDLSTCEGKGRLIAISDDEYTAIIGKSDGGEN